MPMRRFAKKQIGSLLLLLAIFTVARPAVAQETSCLELKGSLLKGRAFNRNDLSALPHTEITETRRVGVDQQQDTLLIKYRGVLLRDLLNAAAFQEKERYDFRKTIVIAKARDGYIALFTWGELFNTKLGDQVLVITEVDGKSLTEAEGPCVLRSLGDIKPGPRHVKWLSQIEVIKVAP
jgi:DMSO/TMAO reductase YedYZ molybdopterin-dependent catalytic subunit